MPERDAPQDRAVAPERPAENPSEAPDAPVSNGGPPPPVNVVADLRRRREAISEDRRFTAAIPGYGDRLFARYRTTSIRDLLKARKKAQKNQADDATAITRFASNMAVNACEMLLVRVPDDDPLMQHAEEETGLVPLHLTAQQFGDEPVRYDDRLAVALGFEDELPQPSTAASVVRLVFKNPYALQDHMGRYEEWLKETSSDDDEDF